MRQAPCFPHPRLVWGHKHKGDLMKRILILSAVFFLFTGLSPELWAQTIGMVPVPPADRYKGPDPSPTGPLKPSRPGGHDRPGGDGRPGYHRPGHDRPGGDGRPGYDRPGHGKPGWSGGGSWNNDTRPSWRKKPLNKSWRFKNDCWPYGCGGYSYNYYQEPQEDQNINITIVEPEPPTYFTPGFFEPFDDPRDKNPPKKTVR